MTGTTHANERDGTVGRTGRGNGTQSRQNHPIDRGTVPIRLFVDHGRSFVPVDRGRLLLEILTVVRILSKLVRGTSVLTSVSALYPAQY
jgi:hypothetical protein